MSQDLLVLENSKILRSIWKNTFDKILEIKVSNKLSLKQMKSEIMIEEQKKIDEKYDKDYNEQFTQNKIEVAKARNSANLEKMKLKNDLVDKIMEETLEKIKLFADPQNDKYKKLIEDLIIESMVKMLEPTCYVQIRKKDLSFINSILNKCEKRYEEFMKQETGRKYTCKLIVDESEFIENEFGGIKLLNKDKKIILGNDLKTRLFLSRDQHMPIIKNLLFPKKAQ